MTNKLYFTMQHTISASSWADRLSRRDGHAALAQLTWVDIRERKHKRALRCIRMLDVQLQHVLEHEYWRHINNSYFVR